ncbi:MAG: hypothetical protein Q9227_007022 [Pyrenula ochraceoflavens]
MPYSQYIASFGSFSTIAVALSVIAALFWPQNKTYCYDSVKTLTDPPSEANCFTVSESGVFSSIFSLDSKAAKPYKQAGHVLPGLWDGHGHLLPYGESLDSVNLFGSQSLDDARKRIHNYVLKHEDRGTRNDWIRGIGWDQAAFEGIMPTAADLATDHLLKGKYMMLDRVDVHCVWVSQAVLDLLPKPLPPLPGGEVVTDPGMGVFCDNAMDFVRKFWPPPTPEKKRGFLRGAVKELNKHGLVGVHDAGVIPEDVAILKDLVNTPDWSLRVYAMFECPERNTFCPHLARKLSHKNGYLNLRAVKLFAGYGALGSWGSALIDPYSDRPSTRGSLLVNSSTLTYLANSWSSLGYQVNIHAIGDLANRLALNALNSSLVSLCPSSSISACQSTHRFRVEHSQIVHPDDQARMHAIGIIPSIQPTHATSDMVYAETRLGHHRTASEAYRMRSLLPLKPVLGSDFPVEPPNPWQGIYAAATRNSPHTGKGKNGMERGWYVEETLDLMDALRGFTSNAAKGAFLEGKAGVIEKGAYADWVVLDNDIENMDVEKLRTMKVKETWVGGRKVYQRDD